MSGGVPTTADLLAAARRAGAVATLAKPFTPGDVRAALGLPDLPGRAIDPVGG